MLYPPVQEQISQEEEHEFSCPPVKNTNLNKISQQSSLPGTPTTPHNSCTISRQISMHDQLLHNESCDGVDETRNGPVTGIVRVRCENETPANLNLIYQDSIVIHYVLGG